MTFVNQIAEIVHGVVDECWGAVNKNDGHLAVKKTNDVFSHSTSVSKDRTIGMRIPLSSIKRICLHPGPLARYVDEKFPVDCRQDFISSLFSASDHSDQSSSHHILRMQKTIRYWDDPVAHSMMLKDHFHVPIFQMHLDAQMPRLVRLKMGY